MVTTASLVHEIVEYDGPQVFLARDVVGGTLICIAVPTDSGEKFVCVRVGLDQLETLKRPSGSLRSVLKENSSLGWYLADPASDGFDAFQLEARNSTLPEDYLPTPEFDISPWMVNFDGVAELAALRGRPVACIRVDPPEASDSRIRTNTLAALLIEFQKLVKTAVKSRRQPEPSESTGDTLSLNTFAFGQGSFKVYFESGSSGDLLGSNDVEIAFGKISRLMAAAKSLDQALEILRSSKGRFVASLQRVLEILDTNDSYLELEWAAPQSPIQISRIERSQVEPLLRLLESSQDLSVDSRDVVGYFLSADVQSGAWKVMSGSEEISGRSLDPKLLSGVVLEGQQFLLKCREEIEENLVTGREKRRLILHELSDLSRP